MPTLFQICVEGNTGSTGRMAEQIGRKVLEKGWSSYIGYGRFARPSASTALKIGTAFDIFMHGLQTRFFDRHCLGSKHATQKLVEQIREIKPDIIHLHHLHGYYINIEVLFKFLSESKIPVVWTFHDCWSITGHCTYFDDFGCNKWKTECNNCPQKKEYPASFFIDRSRLNFFLKKNLFTSVPNMVVVCVSKWLDGIVKQSFMGGISRKVIYNGVDIDVFSPIINQSGIKEKMNRGSGFMILGVASPWGKRKGLDDFVKLSSHLGKTDFIVLVGLNNSQIKKLPHNIIGIPRTESQQQLNDLYATADVYVNLSVEETFGLTTAEALSCGTPAIVYNTTACPEIVDIQTGIVVKKHDINELLGAVELVKQNGKAYYSGACRMRAIKYFNKNERFAEYTELYDQMIKSNLVN